MHLHGGGRFGRSALPKPYEQDLKSIWPKGRGLKSTLGRWVRGPGIPNPNFFLKKIFEKKLLKKLKKNLKKNLKKIEKKI